ncbi:MAG TPA: response regulator [Candidatus Limnocylindria bacterium]
METGGHEGTRTRIVVADDSASLRALVRITLASQGWTITEAETAESARETIRTQKPDLALLDVTFGDTGPDGLAVCAQLRADPATANIPIVILTAHDDAAERERAKAAGASAFIAKPFGPIDLMTVVRGLLPDTEVPALGVYLLESGAVQPKQLEAALAEQHALGARGTQRRLGDVLVERGAASAVDIERALIQQMRARERRASRVPHVLIVDDHRAVRDGLRQLIITDPDLEIAGEASDADEALRLASATSPDVIVLDNEMPGRRGLDILSELHALVPDARIVMFSLDDGLRDAALRSGASAFVAKDAPVEDVLHALRGRAIHVEVPIAPRSPGAPRAKLRQTAEALAGILLLYVVLFVVVLEPIFGASAGVFAIAVAAMAGALLGPEAGLVGAALAMLVTLPLWVVTGHPIGEPVFRIGSGVGLVALVLVGAASGAMRELGLRLDPRRRRIEALTEVVHSLSGVPRAELIDAFLGAIRRVLPAEAALLYANARGEAQIVRASVPGLATDSLRAVVRESFRAASPRVVDEVPLGERAAPALSTMLIVPVSVPGQEVRGAIVLLGHSSRRYRVHDAQLVAGFSQYLWIVLGNLPAGARDVAPGRAEQRAV